MENPKKNETSPELPDIIIDFEGTKKKLSEMENPTLKEVIERRMLSNFPLDQRPNVLKEKTRLYMAWNNISTPYDDYQDGGGYPDYSDGWTNNPYAQMSCSYDIRDITRPRDNKDM